MLSSSTLGQERGILAHPAPPIPPRPRGVLIVDDEAALRITLNLWLRQDGFKVWLAADGFDAVALYHKHRHEIAAVLLDVRMPGLDGPQTLALLREINPDVRCCFMTGSPGEFNEQELLDLGGNVLGKPFSLPDATDVIWNLLTGSRTTEPEKALQPR